METPKRLELTEENVENSPDGKGVLTLWHQTRRLRREPLPGGEFTIRRQLREYLTDNKLDITHFEFESCDNPVMRLGELADSEEGSNDSPET